MGRAGCAVSLGIIAELWRIFCVILILFLTRRTRGSRREWPGEFVLTEALRHGGEAQSVKRLGRSFTLLGKLELLRAG